MGYNAGAHVMVPVGKHSLETGLDYLYSPQTFTYNDPANQYYGTRDINTSQIALPITFNLGINRHKFDDGLFQLKLGYLIQRNFVDVTDHTSTLPQYEVKDWSHGFTFGFNVVPFVFQNNNRLGFSLEFYRGSQIYEDVYNDSSFEMPGSSFTRLGCFYRIY